MMIINTLHSILFLFAVDEGFVSVSAAAVGLSSYRHHLYSK